MLFNNEKHVTKRFSLFSLQARLNDRDEIRRKLAAGNESEGENEDYYTSDYIKKTMSTTSHRRRQGKQKRNISRHHNLSINTFNTSFLMKPMSSIMISLFIESE
jgi:hypothetical protein